MGTLFRQLQHGVKHPDAVFRADPDIDRRGRTATACCSPHGSQRRHRRVTDRRDGTASRGTCVRSLGAALRRCSAEALS
jgi:hypothetical protein